MSKKSGLADSPFFVSPTPPSPQQGKVGTEEKTLYLNKRTDEQTNERSNVQGYRPIVRKSYDVFLDQSEMIDEWVIKQQRKAGRHVTKGEVMREIIDFFFQKKKT